MNSLCKYKDSLGKPNEGFHSTRLFNIAIFDLLGTITIAFLISYFLDKPFWIIFIGLFISGIILHRLFCVNTTINKLVFGKV